MMRPGLLSNLIACDGLGKYLSLSDTVARDQCCYLNAQNSTACKRIFAPRTGLLDSACPNGPEKCRLYEQCRSAERLYTSAEQNNKVGNGSLLLARYKACANFPIIASFSSNHLLEPHIEQVVQKHLRIGPDETEFDVTLEEITLAVTDCLSATCSSARDSSDCYSTTCSPVKLITNNTFPNIWGINGCLNNVCNIGTSALPWADADIIGVGVFSSYVMQCALAVILWAGLALFSWHHARKGQLDRPSEKSDRLLPSKEPNGPAKEPEIGRHFAAWIDLLLEFHKAQCYFGGTLMIAITVRNFHYVDFVTTFMFTPLATNSILPIIFTYLLLVYYRASSPAVTILTTVVYAMASHVYWILYDNLQLERDMTEADFYKRYRLNISAVAQCGQYSGLSACPIVDEDSGEFSKGIAAWTSLRVLTPMIWTWSTLVFLALLLWPVWARIRARRMRLEKGPGPSPMRRALLPWRRAAFWLATVLFLAGVGMQIFVLFTAIQLDMVDAKGWSFGQVVAITVWIPPLLEYVCGEIILRKGVPA